MSVEESYRIFRILQDFINRARRIVDSDYINHIEKKKQIRLIAENGLAECTFDFTLNNGKVDSFHIDFSRKHMNIAREALETGDNTKYAVISKQPMKFNYNSPKKTAIEAIALNMRFFCQDNEEISLQRIAHIYNNSIIPPLLKHAYNELREDFNKYLDSRSFFASMCEPGDITNREIFDIYLYGNLVHLNPRKKEIFRKIHLNPMKSINCDATFIFVAISFSSVLREIIKVHKKTIQYLKYNIKFQSK